jgi:hypothetical protein
VNLENLGLHLYRGISQWFFISTVPRNKVRTGCCGAFRRLRQEDYKFKASQRYWAV